MGTQGHAKDCFGTKSSRTLLIFFSTIFSMISLCREGCQVGGGGGGLNLPYLYHIIYSWVPTSFLSGSCFFVLFSLQNITQYIFLNFSRLPPPWKSGCSSSLLLPPVSAPTTSPPPPPPPPPPYSRGLALHCPSPTTFQQVFCSFSRSIFRYSLYN